MFWQPVSNFSVDGGNRKTGVYQLLDYRLIPFVQTLFHCCIFSNEPNIVVYWVDTSGKDFQFSGIWMSCKNPRLWVRALVDRTTISSGLHRSHSYSTVAKVRVMVKERFKPSFFQITASHKEDPMNMWKKALQSYETKMWLFGLQAEYPTHHHTVKHGGSCIIM